MVRTTVIAEIGINHNGDIKIAQQLIDAAKFAGANLVKFQKRTINKVYTKEDLDKARVSPWGTTNREQKEGLEFTRDEYDMINNYCKLRDIDWCASPWDLDSLEFLKPYECKHQKLASALLTHTELVTQMALQRIHTYISTGMSTLEEVDKVVEIFENMKCAYTLMHCNSEYPMPDYKANLNVITTLKQRYDKGDFYRGVGYSGHEVGLITSIAAVIMGARVIERHITLDRSMYGSDQASSVEPMGLYKMIEYIRTVEQVVGDGKKTITPEEEACKAKLRRTEDVK